MAHLWMIFPLKPPFMVGIFHGYVKSPDGIYHADPGSWVGFPGDLLKNRLEKIQDASGCQD